MDYGQCLCFFLTFFLVPVLVGSRLALSLASRVRYFFTYAAHLSSFQLSEYTFFSSRRHIDTHL